AAEIDAIAEETVEARRGDDPGDVAVPQSKLVVRRARSRLVDVGGGSAAVVEGPQLRQHVGVADRDTALRVADAQIAGAESPCARRRQGPQQGWANEADKNDSCRVAVTRAEFRRFPDDDAHRRR